jgi:Domain of unknown function (DUF2382)/PRC-barrel domain
MPALDPEARERWRDLVVVDRDAATVGTIARFYLDRLSGRPTWALVQAGWLGDRRCLVPLAEAAEADGEIRLPYTKAQVHGAPQVGTGPELTADHELALAGHYGLLDRHGSVAEPTPTPGTPGTPGAPEPPHRPVPGPPNREGSPAGQVGAPVVHTSPDRPGEGDPDRPGTGGVVVTRSEEELVVGKRTRLRRVRVRKYVVTEYVTRTIPVRREEIRLEELPATDVAEGGADDWGALDQGGAPELEVVLHREEPEIRLWPVPVERVRLRRQLVTERRTVTAELRKEQVEVDQDQRP